MKKHKTKNIFKRLIQKGESSLKDFWHKTRQEAGETKEAGEIFKKYAEGERVTAEEKKFLENQSIDILKVVFIGIPFAIVPGFSIVVIFLVKLGRRYKFNVFPSSFSSKKP